MTRAAGVEFVAMATATDWPRSAWDRPEESNVTTSLLQPDHLHHLAVVYERYGFDALLVPTGSTGADSLVVADQVLSVTTRLGVTVSLDPGVVAPTVAARQLATLSALHPGRVTLHLVTGKDSAEPRQDGDTFDPAVRYRRAAEFVQVLESAWRSEERFSFAGQFYEIADAWSSVRPDGGRLPISIGGTSVEAIALGGQHADIFSLDEQSLSCDEQTPARIAERIAAVRAAAVSAGRDLGRFSIRVRLVTAPTVAEADQKAERYPRPSRYDARGRHTHR